MNIQQMEKKVISLSEDTLYHQRYVCCIDILLGIGYLAPTHLEDWRRGKVPYLEKVIQVNLGKISRAMRCFRKWAKNKNLKPSETVYLAKTRGAKRILQFSKSGKPSIELAYRTHYVSPLLSEKKQQRLQEKLSQVPEIVVICTTRNTVCGRCNQELWKGTFIIMDNDNPHCMTCAKLDTLAFLPSGNTKLTRRAKKYSKQSFVVVKFSRVRKRYERQGLLVEKKALEKAEKEIRI